MKRYTLVLLLVHSILANDYVWVDDKSQTELFNCDGYVTDAICCQDKICQGQSESTCTADSKRALFCGWDSSKGKCLPIRDAENNVCCQKKPMDGCKDFVSGRCPQEFQVTFFYSSGA